MRSNLLRSSLLGVLLAGLALPASAVTIDLRNAGGSGGYGNGLGFNAGGIGLNVSAWAETGSTSLSKAGYYYFQSAQVWSWSTGIGICNRSEGLANNNCDNNEHEVDTVGYDDLIAFLFDRPVDFASLTVDPYDGSGSDPNDRDIIYWVGNVDAAPNLTSYTFSSLADLPGISPETWLQATSSYNPLTHSLSGTGNLLLVSGNYHDRNCRNADVTTNDECEAYKIANITVSASTSVVPVPAAAWLFGPALGLLSLARRRSA